MSSCYYANSSETAVLVGKFGDEFTSVNTALSIACRCFAVTDGDRDCACLTAIFSVPEVFVLVFVGAGMVEVLMTTGAIKMLKAPVTSSPPRNQHPAFYRLDALPVTEPTASKH